MGGVIDYREQILGLARDAMHCADEESAFMFYSMYFEHETNALISCLLRQRDISHKSRNEIMKKGWREKLTWLIEVLGLNPPQADFLACLSIINEEKRKGFVHYKWSPLALGGNRQALNYQKEEEIIEWCVRYFRVYSTRCIYGGKKRVIHEKIDLIVRKFEFITLE